MGQATTDDVVRRYAEAIARGDLDAQESLRHPGWTADWPQSGERVTSSADFRSIQAAYPGGAPRSEIKRLLGPEDQWVVTPSNTAVRVAGCGDFWWSEWMSTYPDGVDYLTVALIEMRDGLIHREIVYWSTPFEAPDWRSAWVTRSR
jgi:hypothetical protein